MVESHGDFLQRFYPKFRNRSANYRYLAWEKLDMCLKNQKRKIGHVPEKPGILSFIPCNICVLCSLLGVVLSLGCSKEAIGKVRGYSIHYWGLSFRFEFTTQEEHCIMNIKYILRKILIASHGISKSYILYITYFIHGSWTGFHIHECLDKARGMNNLTDLLGVLLLHCGWLFPDSSEVFAFDTVELPTKHRHGKIHKTEWNVQ